MNFVGLYRTILVLMVILALTPSARAEFKATPEEVKMCAAVIYNGRAVKGDPNWAHAHHYCDCLRFTNRAYSLMGKDRMEFVHNLNEAMGGCNYVISHATPDFSLLPEIYLQKGTIYSLRGQDALATAEYYKAINGNPKLSKAYLNLANFFIKKNANKQALEIVTKGVINNSDSKALKRMYKELGGKMPFPTPAVVAEETSPKKSDEVAATKPVIAAEQPAAAEKVAETPTETPPVIGSPTNPWCRFCPDTPATPPATTPSMPGVIPKADR